MNWERYLPPNIRLTCSKKKHPVIVTFTFLSDIDISDEDLIHENNRLIEKYHKFRMVIKDEMGESCAEVAKHIVMRNILFLKKIWNQVAECHQNVDLVFRFGNGSMSKIYVRHEDCTVSNDSHLITLELSICLKIIRHGRSCVLEPSDNFYQHCRLALQNNQEVYIYPSKIMCNTSDNPNYKNDVDNTNLFIHIKKNEISRVYFSNKNESQTNIQKSEDSWNQRTPLRRSTRIRRSEMKSTLEETHAGSTSEMDEKTNTNIEKDLPLSQPMLRDESDEESDSKSPVRMAIKTPRAKNTMNDEDNTKEVLTPFILFCNDKRAKIRNENPNIEATHLMKKLEKLWREAGSELKAKYTDQSKRVSVEVSEKIDAYRRIKSATVQHECELRPSESSKDFKDVKVSGRKRKISRVEALKDESKDEAIKDEVLKDESKNESNQMLTDQKKENNVPDKPKRPPSAFILFSQSFRKKNKGIVSPDKIFKMIVEAWREISSDEKKSYEDAAKIEKDKWKKAMEKYRINLRTDS